MWYLDPLLSFAVIGHTICHAIGLAIFLKNGFASSWVHQAKGFDCEFVLLNHIDGVSCGCWLLYAHETLIHKLLLGLAINVLGLYSTVVQGVVMSRFNHWANVTFILSRSWGELNAFLITLNIIPQRYSLEPGHFCASIILVIAKWARCHKGFLLLLIP